MRTRLLRPEILTDEVLGGLPDPLVLFYMKLWLLTDDAGYFDWRPRQIAATLYPYRGDRRREREVIGWLAELVSLERVSKLLCGAHAVIPTIPKYRTQGGNLAYATKRKHDDGCKYVRVQPSPTESPSESESESESSRPDGRVQTGLKERLGPFEDVVKAAPG